MTADTLYSALHFIILMAVLPFVVILRAHATSKQTRKSTFISMAQSHIAPETPPSQASDPQGEKPENRSAQLDSIQLRRIPKNFPMAVQITLKNLHAEIILYLYINISTSCRISLTEKPHEQMLPQEGLLLQKSRQGLQTHHDLSRNAYLESRRIC